MTPPEALTAAPFERPKTHADFERLSEPYRRGLKVHCYRLMGSLSDAEDLVQETLLRAWRALDGFEGRSSFRGWLYRIATHACFDALDSKKARSLPELAGRAAAAGELPSAPSPEALWLEPIPDALLDDEVRGPEARYSARESVALAFLAAIQHLPAKQRAALLLRDVLGFPAEETAELLGTTVPAANSALQRARDSLEARRGLGGFGRPVLPTPEDAEHDLLRRYVQAWERSDTSALVALLTEDARLSMPPHPTWYEGRAAVGGFVGAALFAPGPGAYQAKLVRANGQPAVALWARGPDGSFAPLAIQVLELAGGRVAAIDSFLLPGLFPSFGLR
ncbi:MAG: sigma-70 family RNA polymerase sigma factor [Myxococcaceae bacterium]